MISRKITFQFSLVLIGFALSAYGLTQPCPKQLSKVDLSESASTLCLDISDTFGQPISSATTTIRNYRNGNALESRGTPVVFTGIQFGTYEIAVAAPGFAVRRQMLILDRQTTFLKIGVCPSRGHGDALGNWKIALNKQSSGGNMWIRLIPVFSNDTLEAVFNDDLSVEFNNLDAGRYVALIFDGPALKETRAIDYYGGSLRTEL